jgi:cell division inhibitor SepF
MWRKTMTYLGLGPDEEYEDDGYYEEPGEALSRPARPSMPSSPPRPTAQPSAGPRIVPAAEEHGDVRVVSAVRTLPPEPAVPAVRPQVEDVVPIEPMGAAVRPMPATARARPHVVSPTSFDDAMDIGNAFKQGLPVIMNLGGADRDLARRLIDFASGVCFGLEGSMERVAPQVYLITPTDVEVSDDDRRRLQERGLHR